MELDQLSLAVDLTFYLGVVNGLLLCIPFWLGVVLIVS